MWNYWTGSSNDPKLPEIKQAELLLLRLKKEQSDNQVIKLAFFSRCADQDCFHQYLQELKRLAGNTFEQPVLVSLIPQQPIGSAICLEAWHLPYHPDQQIVYELMDGGQMIYISGQSRLLIVNAYQLSGQVAQDAAQCFVNIEDAIKRKGFKLDQLFRQWNYIGQILKVKEGKQNYQLFNEARANYFTSSSFAQGYPAATGIGMDVPGVLVEACFLISENLKPVVVSNPLQLAAHSYSDKVLVSTLPLKSTPKFERAKALVNHRSSTVFISGTAAILGEDSSASVEPEKQTSQTLHIIQQLASRENLFKHTRVDQVIQSHYKNVRVYLKNGYISDQIKQQVSQFFQNEHPLFLSADICRDNLLVEIEAELQIN